MWRLSSLTIIMAKVAVNKAISLKFPVTGFECYPVAQRLYSPQFEVTHFFIGCFYMLIMTNFDDCNYQFMIMN